MTLHQHHLRFAAWEWGEHQDLRNRRLHIATNLVMTACALLLAARVSIPVPGVGALPLSIPLWTAMAVYVAPLDPLAALLSTLAVAVATLGFGALYLPTGWVSAAVLLGLYGAAGALAVRAHTFWDDHHQARMHDPPGGKWLRLLHVVAFGLPTFVAFALVDAGRRPRMREALEARAQAHFSPSRTARTPQR